MAKIKSNISIDSLFVQPYDSTSRVANSYPGFEHFTSRHDFILFGKMRGIALALSATNLTCGSSRPKTARGFYRADLRNVSNGEIVTSRSFGLRMTADSRVCHERVDLSVKSEQIIAGGSYVVEITEAGLDETLVSVPVCFFTYDRIPHGMFTRIFSAIVDSDGGYCCNVAGDKQPVELEFRFDSCYPSDVRLPEFFIRCVDENGESFEARCDSQLVHDPEDGHDTLVIKATCDSSLKGVVYAEVCLFGHGVAAMLFNLDGSRVPGNYVGDESCVSRDYDPRHGYDLWRERLKSATLRLGSDLDQIDERARNLKTRNEEDEARKTLENMVGLESVRSKVTSYANLTRFNNLRAEASLKVKPVALHSMFLGSPGTGKTTVAKIMGVLMRGAGVLTKGHVVVRERSTLVGRYYDSVYENLKAAVDEARGGILFIDEAYQLYVPDDPKDPGRDVLEALLTLLADETQRDIMLILAGYTEPMKRLFEMNPGLKSRIPETNLYKFEDYRPDELVEIARRYFKANDFVLTPEADERITALLNSEYESRDEKFGNARHVVSLIENRILPALADRLAEVGEPSVDQLKTVTASDVPAPALVVRPCRERKLGFAC